MATEQFTNNAQTTLNGAITNVQTSIVVNSNAGFPSVAQFRIIIDSEIMLVTAGAGTTTWTVTRGNNLTAPDTTANAAHNNAATVTHILTAGNLTNFVANPTSYGNWGANTLTLSSIAANYGEIINGPSNVGQSLGLQINAGTNSSDFALLVNLQNATSAFAVRGDGRVIVAGNPGVLAINGTGQATVIGGSTGGVIQNNANNAANFSWTDAGLLTMRNAISVPPSAGASLPSTNYGTLPVKLDDQSTASAASLTLTPPTGGLYRTLIVYVTGRSDQASSQVLSVQFNADVGANYDYGAIVLTNTSVAGLTPGIAGASGRCGALSASGAATGSVSGSIITIFNSDSTTLRKHWTWTGGHFDSDVAANTNWESGFGQWRNTANAITSIKLITGAGNMINARAILYGCP